MAEYEIQEIDLTTWKPLAYKKQQELGGMVEFAKGMMAA